MTTEEILINTFFGFFYSMGDVVDILWAGAFGVMIALGLTRILAKKE